ncbi:MAG: thioredoxin domain-containing protein [Polyangiaceae bacterium]|nr:thioredoxin domain-containing protein [Polyangiaceae bacterium]
MPLLVALLSAGAAGCPGKSEPADNQPAASPEVSLTGVDTSSLTPRERREWAGQVSELLAPCPDTPVSIAQCVKEQRPCKSCLPAAQLLLKQVKAGASKKEREDAFHARFDPNKIKTLSIEGSPTLGPPDAVVTIVEWADFECPFCRLIYPMLDELAHRFPGQVRVVFKFYPLGSHPHGEIAARAAIAAMNQGKFWEMHHMLFDHQENLEQQALETYAKELKLDLAKFKQDLTSPETTARIEKDKKQGEEVGLEGTPMIFINGREVDLKLLTNPYEDLEDWVKLDIELAGKVPAPAPPKSSAAAPAAPKASVAAPDAPPPSAPSAAPSAGAAPSAAPKAPAEKK